jgi:tripeptide aminopeptidase
MLRYVGKDLIVTDGVSLLGADDKAGVAEIMELADRLIRDDTIKHGKVSIAFTPDEEIGQGTDHFDIDNFDAECAYTVDGGAVGEIEYENFNAATAFISIHGKDIHPGEAKGIMINAARIAGEFDGMLPQDQRPECTEGYDGFFHLTKLNATNADAQMQYLVRDHDAELFEQKKELMKAAAAYINAKYGDVLKLEIKDAYRNMKEIVEPHMYLIDDAKAAFEACGVEPKVIAIRGGTDGAMLSYKGLPCPNLSTGGHNFHSNTEYVPVQSIETMADVLTEIVRVK